MSKTQPPEVLALPDPIFFLQMTNQIREFVTKFGSLESKLFELATDFGETLQEFDLTSSSSPAKALQIPVPDENSGLDGKINCLVELFQIAAEKLQVSN